MSITRGWKCVILGMGLWMIGGAASAANSPPAAMPDTVESFGRDVLVDVLANDRDVDGQRLAVTVLGGTCDGTYAERDGLVELVVPHHRPQTCTIDYRVSDGSLTATSDVTVTAIELHLFSDGFESGDVNAWN